MLHFVEIEKRMNKYGTMTYNVDGYSDRKTLSGAIREIGREISKIDAGEGELITKNAHTKEDALSLLVQNTSADTYCFEMEDVPCASRYNEETDEVEYQEGNYYFHIRFFE